MMECKEEVPPQVVEQRARINETLSHIGQQLDKRYRKMNLLGSISRDITWESKKAISTSLGFFQNPAAISNAERNIRNVRTGQRYFKDLAKALVNEDMNLYGRYYTSGLQEFVEALAVINFFKNGTILTYEEVLNALTVEIEAPESSEEGLTKSSDSEMITFSIHITKREFFLGLLDIPGELVRACASVLYTTEFKSFLLKSLALVRAMYQCIYMLVPLGKDLNEKFSVMRASMVKLEVACFDCVVGRQLNNLFFTKPIRSNLDDRDQDPEDSGFD